MLPELVDSGCQTIAMQKPGRPTINFRGCDCNLQELVGLSRHTLRGLRSLLPYRFGFDSTNRILRCWFEEQITDNDLKDYYRLVEQYAAQIAPPGGILDISCVTNSESKTRQQFVTKTRPFYGRLVLCENGKARQVKGFSGRTS
jgi:hypothetical protein